ncbi:hypothetical protein B0J14DRAFT_607502 [Halenospora varia]|nr:hypothetical protein B0J14DRAFT_607502 [Halenospora varia]
MDYLSTAMSSAFQRKDEMSQNTKPKKGPNPMSYPKSAEPFSLELFENPTSEYRGCPFWAWNTRLDKDQLLRQIDYFQEMGMGGFHMHVRVGLDTEYMGTEFMDLIQSCVDYAEKKKMLACLYDEDRWPSGSAGGLVIQKWPETKAKHIVFTPRARGSSISNNLKSDQPIEAKESHLLARYSVTLDENGCLKSSKVLKKGEAGINEWYLYEETNGPDPWFNDQTYVDTLSEDAMGKFISITHEKYKEKVGDKFGTTIPCIFTDEPQFTIKRQLGNPKSQDEVIMPWTTDLPHSYKKLYSSDLIEDFPQIVWNLPAGQASAARYRFHDHTCERFVTAFMDQISAWCRKNNIFLDGHMMEEPRLQSQTAALGEAMRCYRSMDMPGMDLLCDWTEYNTAKQVTSVARQNGLRGAMSELYGVTHWDFTFEGHKGCGDWQAVLGITFRVHHLTWVSMAGEGKRDYPACIGYQSPWYKEYGYIESHFARVGVAMTRGKAVTRVAVVHPIESYWLAFGPNGSGDELDVREKAFGDLTWWLLHGHIDFDFISESLLPGQSPGTTSDNKFKVGACEYDVVILPNLRTIRSTTLKALRAFTKAGGNVIIAGMAPDLVDAQVPKSTPSIEGSRSILWGQQSIVNALEEYRDIKIFNEQGNGCGRYLYQMRQDDDGRRFVFIVNRERNDAENTTINLKGEWALTALDTLTGTSEPIIGRITSGWTTFPHRFEGCSSLLLHLTPLKSPPKLLPQPPPPCPSSQPHPHLPPTSWSAPTEVLRIDNEIRSRLGMPRKGGAWRQPWTVPFSDREARTRVTMKFEFTSRFTISSVTRLALEDPHMMKVTLNNLPLTPPKVKKGEVPAYWVDEAIQTIPIPGNTIKSGINTLTVSFPFGILTNIERLYILGEFSVHVDGRTASIAPLNPGLLNWGNIVDQGFPFYVGNVTYNINYYTASSRSATLHVPDFSSPLLSITDGKSGKKIGNIAFQPRRLELGEGKGIQRLSVTCYGNRFNSFGHIHMPGWITACFPDVWRSGGDWWTDNYDLKPVGVLSCPTVELYKSPLGDSTSDSPSIEDPSEQKLIHPAELYNYHQNGGGKPNEVSEGKEHGRKESSGSWVIVVGKGKAAEVEEEDVEAN